MTVVEHIEANSASLSLSHCDGLYHVSCIRLTPAGELDHDVELYVKSFTEAALAAKIYIELEAALKMAERYCYKAKARLLMGVAKMTETNHSLAIDELPQIRRDCPSHPCVRHPPLHFPCPGPIG